jgi:GNAT superfamily N-acetyltransferase
LPSSSPSSALRLQTLIGRDIAPYVGEVARIRIRHFRAFPYLYDGSLAYEEHYLQGYVTEPRAMLIRVLDGGEPVAIATATPLASSADIVADAPRLFAAAGQDPRDYYYYAEIIVLPEHRARGIARLVYAEREAWARRWGYRKLCLAVVQRPADHPLRPADYKSPERIWQRDGFELAGIEFDYDWPTLQADGTTRGEGNRMAFWTKDLT